jgi:hypothetical protein
LMCLKRQYVMGSGIQVRTGSDSDWVLMT